MNTGIYKITNLITNKMYIGSTTASFKKRFGQHLSMLRKNKHTNIHLQRSFNKYGESNFKFEIIEVVESYNCINREQYWIEHFDSSNLDIGYNICGVAGNTFGTKRTDEQKKNISNSLIGKMSKEKHPMWGVKREPTMLGKKHTKEAIDKMTKYRNENPRTESQINHFKKVKETQIGENHPRYGIKLTGDALKHVQNLRVGVPSYATRRPVVEFDLHGNIIEKFECLRHAANKYNTSESVISKVCSRSNHVYKKEHIFLYKEDYENNLECIEFIKNLK